MHSQSVAKKHAHITFLGDSTIDNKVWVDGLYKNIIYTQLGFKNDAPAVRVAKSHHWYGPYLSVVENMMDMLPAAIIHDYTNDGFTTGDMLHGNYKDKVFGNGTLSLFPHEWFCPLTSGADDIKKSDYIILSVGGNDFREFLLRANGLTDNARKNYIQDQFPELLKNLQQNYLSIYQQIRKLNNNSQLILMTQYYPAVSQTNPLLKLYPFMHEIGKALNMGGDNHEAMSVIHEIMKQTYTNIFKQIANDNSIVVVDITSSLNPYDESNYVSQIEPSGKGGKKIAQMLKYIMMSNQIITGCAYRFTPSFFTSNDEISQYVERTALNQWIPTHPYDLFENDRLLSGVGIKLFDQKKQKSLSDESIKTDQVATQQPRM